MVLVAMASTASFLISGGDFHLNWTGILVTMFVSNSTHIFARTATSFSSDRNNTQSSALKF